MAKEAHPGTISSVILSVFVAIMLLMPFYTANHMQRYREGLVTYEFKDRLCFDINDRSQIAQDTNAPQGDSNSFLLHRYGLIPFSHEGNVGNWPGVPGSFVWVYMTKQRFSQPHSFACHNPVQVKNTPIREGTVDEYILTYTGVSNTWTVEYYSPGWDMYMPLTVTWGDLLDCDLTKINIYFSGATNPSVSVRIGGWGSSLYWSPFSGTISDNTLEIEVSVDDLLTINGYPVNDKIVLKFHDSGNSQLPNRAIYFDMQFYNIEETKITTVDWSGIVMIAVGMLMSFCSILMLPNVTFSRVISLFIGKRN